MKINSAKSINRTTMEELSIIYLYESNKAFIEGEAANIAHEYEIWTNFQRRFLELGNTFKISNIPKATFLLAIGGIFSLAGGYSIFDAVNFALNIIPINFFNILQIIGAVFVGLVGISFGIVCILTSYHSLKSVSKADLIGIVENLLEDGNITTGKVVDIFESNKKKIIHVYTDRKNRTWKSSFETNSPVSIEHGDTICVIYNVHGDALM